MRKSILEIKHLRWILDVELTNFFRIPDGIRYQRAVAVVNFAHLAGIISVYEWNFLFRALDSVYINSRLSV